MSIKYFGLSERPQNLTGPEYLPMAKLYWGTGPLPKDAEIIGAYSDSTRAGALIRLANGRLVCGIAGSISNIKN